MFHPLSRRDHGCLCTRTKGCCGGKLRCCSRPRKLLGVENKVSDTETACLDGGLRSEPSVFGDVNLDGVTADLAPAQAEGKKDEGGGRDWRRTSCVTNLSARSSLSWTLRKEKSWEMVLAGIYLDFAPTTSGNPQGRPE